MVGKLEAEANFEAKLMFHHDSRKVMLITYMINKHRMDTKVLSRDPKNHDEETIAKLMGMATYFISIPEYYAPYCKRAYMTSSNKKDEEKEDEENAEDADDGSF